MSTPYQASTISIRLFRPETDPLRLSPVLIGVRENQPERPGFDESLHRLVAVTDKNRIIGFADAWKPPGTECAELTLAWDHESNASLNPELLSEAVKTAAAQGASSLLAYADRSDETVTRLLAQEGFEQGSGYRQLSLQLDQEPREPRWPNDLELRSFDEFADRELLIDASDKCYAGLWGHKPADEQVLDLLLASFPADGILLLLDSSKQAVGLCKTTGSPTGYIDGPGLATPYRANLELYAEMVRAALTWQYRAGHKQIILESWGDPDNVTKVYSDMGFKVEVDTPAYRLGLGSEKPRA